MTNPFELVNWKERALIAEAELAKARDDAEAWKFAFSAQSRKLQAVLHIPGVKDELAALSATPEPRDA